MAIEVDYYFGPSSPWSYLGHDRFLALAARRGFTVRYRPADVGAMMSAAGGLPVKERPWQRQQYRLMELRRWKAALDLPLNVEPRFFPVAAATATALIEAAHQQGHDPGALIGALMRAVWVEERDIADEATLRAIADACGLDGVALLNAAASEAVQAAIQVNTEAGKAAGVFGVPTYVLDGELFWGQDRLELLERALDGK